MDEKRVAVKIPAHVKFEQREDFLKRVYAAFDRAEKKWGQPPGYVLRSRIIGALSRAFRDGEVGSEKFGRRLQGYRGQKAARKAIAKAGWQRHEYFVRLGQLSGEAKRRPKVVERSHVKDSRLNRRRSFLDY